MGKSKNELGYYCYVTFMGRKKNSPWRCKVQNASRLLSDSKMTKSKSARTILLISFAIESIEFLIKESKTDYIVPYCVHNAKFSFTRPFTFVDC